MKIKEFAISLGVVEKDGGVTKSGETYEGYTALNYVVVGDNESRRFYVPKDDKELKRRILTVASEWGARFVVSGDLNSKGKLVVEDVSKD